IDTRQRQFARRTACVELRLYRQPAIDIHCVDVAAHPQSAPLRLTARAAQCEQGAFGNGVGCGEAAIDQQATEPLVADGDRVAIWLTGAALDFQRNRVGGGLARWGWEINA